VVESENQSNEQDGEGDGEYLVEVEFALRPRFATEYPHVLHSEYHSFLLFCLDDSNPSRHRTGIVEWIKCESAILTDASEETRSEWGMFNDPRSDDVVWMGKVVNSSWLEETRNRYLPKDPRHHFVIPFHDTVFQCLAEGFKVRTDPRPLVEVLPNVAAEVADRWKEERVGWEASESFRAQSDPSWRHPKAAWPWE
jgi:hypothetical protein